jgi:hypothetical protein
MRSKCEYMYIVDVFSKLFCGRKSRMFPHWGGGISIPQRGLRLMLYTSQKKKVRIVQGVIGNTLEDRKNSRDYHSKSQNRGQRTAG